MGLKKWVRLGLVVLAIMLIDKFSGSASGSPEVKRRASIEDAKAVCEPEIIK